MKVTTQKPTVPTPAPSQKQLTRKNGNDSSGPRATAETASTSIPTSERQSKLAERGIVENFLREQLLGSAEAGRLRARNPGENTNVIQDPRQLNLQNGAGALDGGLRDEVLNRGENDDGWGPIGEGSMDIVVAPPRGDDRPDVLDDSFSPEDRLRQGADDRISQRSQETKDSNSQSDGDFLTFAGYAAVGVLGMFAGPVVGAAATVGAIAVGGVNYLYDAIIEDMDNDVVEPGEPGPGPLGDEDVVVDDPVAGTPDADPAATGSQNPDDPSGDNPDPGWTPDLTPRPTVDARDTVRTPANPYGTELSAEEIQARIDALGRFSPRTENAINPGDQGGQVGGDPNAPVPANLPDESPVGDPGSPDGTGAPSVEANQ